MKHKSQNTNNSGCFSGILSIILCRNGEPTEPSNYTPKQKPNTDVLFDNFPNVKDQTKFTHPKAEAESSKPGIVARLMGLESLPDSKLSPKLMMKSPESVFRSRSVNFMDYLLEMDLKEGQAHRIRNRHRRVKTSLSFREVPGMLHQQQHDMLVLYLDDAAKERTDTVSKSKTKKEKKEEEEEDGSVRKEKRVVNLIDDETRRVQCRNNYCARGSDEFVKQGENKIKKKKKKKKKKQVNVMEEKEIMSELNFTVKKMKKKKEEKKKIKSVHKQVSETSSPVSVLDVGHHSLRAQKGLVQANKKRGLIPSAKKKNGLDEMEGSERAPSMVDHQLGTEYYLKIVGKVCGILEQDIKTSSNRMATKEDIVEICLKLERAIMDHMIQEAVDELNIC